MPRRRRRSSRRRPARWGWLRAAAAWASARKRRRNDSSSARAGVQHLDRHPAAETDVVGEVDLRRRARPDRREEPVAPAEHTTDLLGHAGHGHGARVPACTSGRRGRPPPAPSSGGAGAHARIGTAMADTSPYSTRFRIVAALVFAVAVALLVFAVIGLDEGSGRPGAPGRRPRRGREPDPPAATPRCPSSRASASTSWPGGTAALVVGGSRSPRTSCVLTPEIGLIEFTPGPEPGGRGAASAARTA